MNSKNDQKNKAWIIAGITVTILAVVIFLFRSAIYQEFGNLKLIPVPETFTELYFNDPNDLPKDAVQGHKGTFSFTIHNVEGVTTSYPYTAYFQDDNGAKTYFLKGTATLASDEKKSITVPYSFLHTHEKGMVVVLLTSLNQQIDFLIPNTN